jgi:hypothetical protein
MSRSLTWLAVVLAVTLAPVLSARAQQVGNGSDSNNAYETLTPYGVWVQVDPWGLAWKPDEGVVGAHFYPYLTNGRWQHTDSGWTWASGYDWGWLPFHYGRWILAGNYGWVWVPGDQWSPAWVTWRTGDRYIGWVPRGPSAEPAVETPAWAFVPIESFLSSDLVPVRVPHEYELEAYRATTAGRFDADDPHRGPDPRLIDACNPPY